MEDSVSSSSSGSSSTWKLYENPFYDPQQEDCQGRRASPSLWDLKTELEFERKVRKKVESMNKRLATELAEERLERQALERVCQELAVKLSSNKSEIEHLKTETEQQRKMVRMAQKLREELVQMKLAEAKTLLEEKLSGTENTSSNKNKEFSRLVLGENFNNGNSTESRSKVNAYDKEKSIYDDKCSSIQRKGEAENPHIARGIKGFVEYPRVVRAIGSRTRNWRTKLECQKAQLRILLKQKQSLY